VDSDNSTEDATGREVAGVVMIFLGVLGIAAIGVVTLGLWPTVGLAACVGLAVGGYRLAASETVRGGTGGRDSEPDEAGVLYVDPDNPEQFIPRQVRDSGRD
jgi:hypothetical protein